VPYPAANPPPLSGGTLAIANDGRTAIVSDPDRDRIALVDLTDARVTAELALRTGDEPGRITEGRDGRVFVALRGAGELATIDLGTRAITERRRVCTAPRGVAWDSRAEKVHVVCAGGELVSLPVTGTDDVRVRTLDRDLRDVVVMGNRLLITRLRKAGLLVVDEEGAIVQRSERYDPSLEASVAWRAVAAPGGGAIVLHQEATPLPVTITSSGGYNQSPTTSTIHPPGCRERNGILRPVVTRVRPPFASSMVAAIPDAPLVIDVAASPVTDRIAVAIPGNAGSSTRAQLLEFSTAGVQSGCAVTQTTNPGAVVTSPGQMVVAVAYDPGGRLVVQTRDPPMVIVPSAGVRVTLGESHANVGHTLFHTNPTGLIACASCHPEAEDDGRVWTFGGVGARRTQYIRTHILGSEPFHWDGDMRDFSHLVSEVMVRRMGASAPSAAEVSVLGRWIDRLPPRPVAAETDAVTRGRALFERKDTACLSCHSGPRYATNSAADVGTGGTFQVPSLLGLAWHPPYMHTGCAATLRDRFNPACGGGDRHGRTSQLSASEIDDLVAFLASL
jgi:cytochrome c553